jgi:hypothetical protein
MGGSLRPPDPPHAAKAHAHAPTITGKSGSGRSLRDALLTRESLSLTVQGLVTLERLLLSTKSLDERIEASPAFIELSCF